MSIFDHPALAEIDALADLFADVGVRVEADPTNWRALWDNELVRAITLMEVPEPYNPAPNCGGLFGLRRVDYPVQVAVAERIARYDASCVLALPTPTMSGYAISVLGNSNQKEAYFTRYMNTPSRSFFAITEPMVGSDATAGTSTIKDQGGARVLNAHKKLVGSAKQADFGLIFAHDQQSNSHKMVVADAETIAHLKITRLPSHGLAGADLTEIEVANLPIADEMILGHGLNRGLRDGFYAMNNVFERYRPIVATLAIGSARGLLDTMTAIGVNPAKLDALMVRHHAFLARLCVIADAYETGQQKVHETSRLKLDAVRFLDDVVSCVFREVPATDLFQHPNLLKRCRDAKSYEYMEGTSNIHLLQAYRSYSPAKATT